MEDLSKYIGLTYRFNMNTRSGGYCNCLTLVKQFYNDKGYPETWDDGKPLPTSGAEPYEKRLYLYLLQNFIKEDNPENLEYGDIVLIKAGSSTNIGVYVGEGNVLTVEKPTIEGKAKSIVYRERLWKPYVKTCFKRKKGLNNER